MNFRGHFYGSLLVGGVVGYSIHSYSALDQSLISFLMVVAGGNFPDVDTHSTPSRLISMIALFVSLYLFFSGYYDASALIGIGFMLCKSSGHRGWTHKYWLPVSLIFLSFYFDFYFFYMLSFSFGLCVHYVLDSIYPFSVKSWV